MAHIRVNIPDNESDFSACDSVKSSIGSKMIFFSSSYCLGQMVKSEDEQTIKTTESDKQI